MSIHSDWLEWIYEQRTDVWIAERTGIPRSTIGFVRRGERELSSAYAKLLRPVYQSETTKRLDALGMPHRESIRFSMKNPEWQRDTAVKMGRIVSDFAIGATEAIADREDWDWNDSRWQPYYDDISEKIRDGIRRSPRPWDDIKEGFVS